MVFMIIIPMKNGYFIGNIPNIFRQTHLGILYESSVEKRDHFFFVAEHELSGTGSCGPSRVEHCNMLLDDYRVKTCD